MTSMATSMATATSGTRQIVIRILACLVLLVDGYDVFILGVVGPSLTHFSPWGANAATIGILASVTAVGLPLGSVLAGWAADRWGRRGPVVTMVVWISLSMLAAGLAPSLGLFVTARLFTGVGIGAIAPLLSVVVADHSPAHRRTLYLTITLAFIGVGGIAATLAGGLLLLDVHFQLMFLPGAAVIILVPLLWWLIPSQSPRPAVGDAAGGRARILQLLTPESRRTTILFWCAAFLAMALCYSTTAWLPTVMTRAGYDLGSSLEFLTVFTAGAVVGGLILSPIADRGHVRIVTLGTFVLAAITLLVVSSPQPRPFLLAVSALAGLGSLGCQNMIIAYMSSFYPPHLRGTGLGIGLGIGRVGAIFGPVYVATITGVFPSYRSGFFAFIALAVLGAITIALMPRRLVLSEEPIRVEAAKAAA